MRKYSKPMRRGFAFSTDVAGAATSASKVAKVIGVRIRGDCIWIEGEGWVKWGELERSVTVAFEEWRARKANQGRFIGDGSERVAAAIRAGLARRLARTEMAAA